MDNNKENETVSPQLAKADWVTAGILSAAAALLYFASMATYAYPGLSAHLAALWLGLDVAPFMPYPLLHPFARIFGYGNAIAPVCGALSVGGLYVVAAWFIRTSFNDEEHSFKPYLSRIPRVGALAAAIIFMLTPCVRSAYSHIEPRGFDFTWAVLTFLPIVAAAGCRGFSHWLLVSLSGVMAGLGFVDTPVFLALLPLLVAALARSSQLAGKKARKAVGLLVALFLLSFFGYVNLTEGDFWEFMSAHKAAYFADLAVSRESWLAIMSLATLPFVLSVMSMRRTMRPCGSTSLWILQSVLTAISVFAVVTPMSPSSLMRPYGIFPVATSALSALVAGFMVAYWVFKHDLASSVSPATDSDGHESDKKSPKVIAATKLASRIVLAVFAVSFVLTTAFRFVAFDRSEGEFADKIAERILSDLGERTWFITDGTLDDHLRIAAHKRGKELNLVCLQRDYDKTYTDALAKLVKSSGIGGSFNNDLVYSLKLGILPFVQDWLSWDKDAPEQVAVYGAPDLWRYGDTVKAVPEFLFFGADESYKYDESSWDGVKDILAAPEKWGSYRLWRENDPMKRMKLNIRRHIGFVANNRGVMLQDEGKDDEAFAAYELVLDKIDSDNVCALFNEIEMMGAGYKKAVAKKGTLTRRFNEIKDDPDRRYKLQPLYNLYGYIRNPEMFLRNGITWARFGRPGEALSHIRRAIDFIPTENRNSLMNMMAALYASEHDSAKSRAIYEAVLEKDSSNHDALIGLMRLEMMNGNREKALEFLERAIVLSGDDPSARVEKAMAHLIRNEIPEARKLLRAAADANLGDMQTWSLLAAATLQAIDAEKDKAKRDSLVKELETDIIVTMEKQSRPTSDYHLQTMKAFLLLRKGDEYRKDARDAFARAARQNPGVAATADIILSLDIALNDVADAERQAKDVLRRNRRAPLANYIMGSIALQRGDLNEAEAFLRRSVSVEPPIGLALNDYAEVLRRRGDFNEAERQARRAVDTAPGLYVAWETLGSILLDKNGSLDEAEQYIKKACDLSKDKDGKETDVRMLVSLARVQIARGDTMRAKATARRVRGRISTLTEYERQEFEELMKGVK